MLENADSISVGVRTLGGRILEYATSLLGEAEGSFSIFVPPELWERVAPGQVVLIKASLPSIFLLFETQVVALEREPVARAELAAADPGRLRRIPRRQHFRVAAVLPVSFTFDRTDAKTPERVVTLNATTFDISSGGVGILVARASDAILPALHTSGQLEFLLASAEPWADRPLAAPLGVKCQGRIARVDSVPRTTNTSLGVGFEAISEQQLVEVSRFVIAHQLALRRRGVLV